MQDKRNKPQHRDAIRDKGLARGLSLEIEGLGHISATKDNSLLNFEGVGNGY